MSNVNSEDTGGAGSDPNPGGGTARVRQLPDEQVGRSLWAWLGSAVVVVVMLVPLVWIVAELGQVAGVMGDSSISWVYAATLVLLLGGGGWFLFRVLRQQRGDDASKGGNV